MLGEKTDTIETPKLLGRPRRTIKKYVSKPDACRARADKEKTRGISISLDEWRLISKYHSRAVSKNIFAAIGAPKCA